MGAFEPIKGWTLVRICVLKFNDCACSLMSGLVIGPIDGTGDIFALKIERVLWSPRTHVIQPKAKGCIEKR